MEHLDCRDVVDLGLSGVALVSCYLRSESLLLASDVEALLPSPPALLPSPFTERPDRADRPEEGGRSSSEVGVGGADLPLILAKALSRR